LRALLADDAPGAALFTAQGAIPGIQGNEQGLLLCPICICIGGAVIGRCRHLMLLVRWFSRPRIPDHQHQRAGHRRNLTQRQLLNPPAPGRTEALSERWLQPVCVRGKKAIPPGTLRALIRDYKSSSEFKIVLSQNTKGYYSRMLDQFRPIAQLPNSAITRQVVMKIRDSMSAKPRSADQFIQVASRLFSWAMECNIPEITPIQRKMWRRSPRPRVSRVGRKQRSSSSKTPIRLGGC
jgi:hypothetical protein